MLQIDVSRGEKVILLLEKSTEARIRRIFGQDLQDFRMNKIFM